MRPADDLRVHFADAAQQHECRRGLPHDLVGHRGAVQELPAVGQQCMEVGHAPAVERADLRPVGHDERMSPFAECAYQLSDHGLLRLSRST